MTAYKIALWVVFGALLAGFSTEVPFIPCGGDAVEELNITNCTESSCILKLGQPYEILVTLDKIATSLVQPETHVGLIQYNAYFEQASVCVNQCVYYVLDSYKEVEYMATPIFYLNVTVSESLLPMPATLRVNTTYGDSDGKAGGFCIEASVELSR